MTGTGTNERPGRPVSVERAFGIGSCALTEVMALPQDHLANAEA